MKLAAFMLIAFIIPAGLSAQEPKVRIEGVRHLPTSHSPDGCWTVTPIYYRGKFVTYEWTKVHAKIVTIDDIATGPVKPPVPPQPPAPPKPLPSPQAPVVPTPQCPMVAPVGASTGGYYYFVAPPSAPSPCTMLGAGCYSAPRGCGLLHRLFGRCR